MGRLAITVLSLVAAAQEPGPREEAPAPGGPLVPEEAAASFELHPDFEITLVAAEPLIAGPTALDWDARERPWIALAPSRAPDGQDALVILADSDGDGRMDERTDFARGLERATSFVFHEDGVILAQAGEILLLRDRDGDDRADETVVLFTGLGSEDGGGGLGHLRWGMDGWVYGTRAGGGVAPENVTGTAGRAFGPLASGVLRFRPDGSAIETVASSADPSGLDFTWDGELFFSAGDSHLRHVVLPESVLASGRVGGASSWSDVADHDRSVPLRELERSSSAPSAARLTGTAGGCFYTGGSWPAEFHGDHFVCAPAFHLVHHDRLTPRGSSFGASKTREAEFLASRERRFRPVQLGVGPDGALYVLDSSDDPSDSASAAPPPRSDPEHGRIWRIQHRDARSLPLPRLADASEAELVAALEHPGLWQRRTAQRLLLEGELSTDVSKALAHQALNAYRPPAKLHALWILALEESERLVRILEHLLRDPEAAVRRNASRALGTLDPWQVARVGSRASALAGDPDPRTRLAALAALRDLLASERERELLERYPALEDDWQRSAVLAIAAQEPARFVEAALALPESAGVVGLITTLAEDVGRRRALKEAVEIVLALGDVRSPSPAVAEAALRALERTLDPELLPWSSTPLDKALLHLVENESVAVALAGLPFAERWSTEGKVSAARRALGPRLGAVAVDPGRGLELRVRALKAMLALPEERAAALEIAATLLDASAPLASQLELVEALARTGDPAAARTLRGAHARLSGPARERIFRQHLERPAWTVELLDALESDEIRAAELGLEERQRLLRHPDPALASRAQAILDERALGAGSTRDADALIAQLLPEVERGGDPSRGRAVFLENCAGCHALSGVTETDGRGSSARMGPDLSGVGALGAAHVLPFLVDPEREIDPAYVEFVAELADGRLVDGVLARETDASIVLRNSAGETEVPRSELVELRSTGRSPMPSGFEALGAEALRDLFAFLAGG